MDADIVIVGSGPAGTSTALHLQQLAPDLARRTLVLERDRHPRNKLCAGGLVRDGEYVLQRLGLDVTQNPHVLIRKAHFQYQGRGFTLSTVPAVFRDFRRSILDGWLADAARARGIAIQEETDVAGLTRLADGIELQTNKGTIKAKIVVGADGSNSVVRSLVSGEADTHLARTLEIIIPPEAGAVEPPPDHNEAIFDYGVIGDGVQGYSWKFPMLLDGKPTWNRGIFDARVYKTTPHCNLKEVFRKKLAEEGLKLDDYRLQGHPIRWFTPDAEMSAERCLLVGDAAGVDPSYGEGISFALQYGKFAAEALKAAFERKDFSFAGYRQAVLDSRMGLILLRRYKMARMLYAVRSNGLQRFVWWRLNEFLKWYVRNYLLDWASVA